MLRSPSFGQGCSRRTGRGICFFQLTSDNNALKYERFFREVWVMKSFVRVALAAAFGFAMSSGAFAADALKEIHIDWATYNPVSMVLKQKGLLEKEFSRDGIGIV